MLGVCSLFSVRSIMPRRHVIYITVHKSHPCTVLILTGALFVFGSNFTVAGSKIQRGRLPGNEGKEVRERSSLLNALFHLFKSTPTFYFCIVAARSCIAFGCGLGLVATVAVPWETRAKMAFSWLTQGVLKVIAWFHLCIVHQ